MAGEDPAHIARVVARPCLLAHTGRCVGAVEPHHPTHLRATGDDGRRAHDRYAMNLCHGHHIYELHGNTGYFKGWKRDDLQAWQDAQLAAMPAYEPGEAAF